MLSATRVIGHKEYGNTPPGGSPGRKSDPVYDMNWRRGRVASFRPRTGAAKPAPIPEDDMPLTQPEINSISDAIANREIASVGGKPYRAWEAWRDAGLKGVDAAKLAAEIVAKLPAPVVSTAAGLTKTDVEAAVRAVFADAAS